MNNLVLAMMICLAWSICEPSLAQVTDQKPSAHPMTRFLDTNTVGVARVDLKLLDVDSIYSAFKKHAGDDPAALRQAGVLKSLATVSRQSLLELGVKQIYLFTSFDDLILGPVSYAVLPTQLDRLRVVELAQPLVDQFLPGLAVVPIDEGVFIGKATVLERIKAARLPVRDDAQALLGLMSKGAKTEDVEIVLALTQDHQKVYREMMVEFGPPLNDISATDVMDGVQAIHVHGKTNPMFLQAEFLGMTTFKLGEESRMNANKKVGLKVNELLEAIVSQELKPFGELPTQVTDSFSSIQFSQNSFHRFDLLADSTALEKFASTVIPHIISRQKTSNPVNVQRSIRQIALAMHNYESAYGKFPSNIVDKDGKPLLSWRVVILPFLGENELCTRFNLEEPWDSPTNKPLISQMPKHFQTYDESNLQHKTIWSIPSGKSYFGPQERILKPLMPVRSEKIMVIGTTLEAANIWSQPNDWSPDPKNIEAGILSVTQPTTYYTRIDAALGEITTATGAAAILELLTIEVEDDPK